MTIVNRLREWAENSVGSAETDDEVVVKTTRYLRLSMVALVIGLAVAVLYEHAKSHKQSGSSGHCWQHSISAYYYTPVQSFFVGALVAIGISLVVLKGSTELEDVWLNFAGIFAPVVAFVPTPNIGDCGSVLTDKTNRDLNIGNNVTAMLVMAGIALAILGVLLLLRQPVTHPPVPKAPDNAAWAHWIAVGGYALALALFVVAWVLFLAPRKWFTDNAHSISAVTMFVFIFLAVVNNAINFHFTRKEVVADQDAARRAGAEIKPADEVKPAKPVNRYLVIAILMAAAVLVIKLGPWFGDYETIWLEASMITLFAVFWVIQTHELWRRGLRTPALLGQPGGNGVQPKGPPEPAELGQ
jgi:hypothetical protein